MTTRPATPLDKQSPKEWTPITHSDAPQPAGHQCANWYKRVQPSACEILYALAHTKGERDRLVEFAKAVRDFTLTDAEGPELRAQNECNHRRAIEILRSLGESE